VVIGYLFHLRKKKDIKVIPISLAIFYDFSLFGPWGNDLLALSNALIQASTRLESCFWKKMDYW